MFMHACTHTLSHNLHRHTKARMTLKNVEPVAAVHGEYRLDAVYVLRDRVGTVWRRSGFSPGPSFHHWAISKSPLASRQLACVQDATARTSTATAMKPGKSTRARARSSLLASAQE